MTLEELASWHEDMAAYALAIGRKDCLKNSLAAAAACRELIDKRGGFCDMCSREIESTTDRLLKECK